MVLAFTLGRPTSRAIFDTWSSLAYLLLRTKPLRFLGTRVLFANDRAGRVPIHCHWYQPFPTGVLEKNRSLFRRLIASVAFAPAAIATGT
jgi:hypothetical protein